MLLTPEQDLDLLVSRRLLEGKSLFSYTEFLRWVLRDSEGWSQAEEAEMGHLSVRLGWKACWGIDNTGPTRNSQKPTVPSGMVNLAFSCSHHHWKRSYFFGQKYSEYSSRKPGDNTALLLSPSCFIFLSSRLQLWRGGQGRRLMRVPESWGSG